VLVPVYALVCVGYTVLLRRRRAAAPVPDPAPQPANLTAGAFTIDNLATDTRTTDTRTTGERPR
jgi:hypothetical protein